MKKLSTLPILVAIAIFACTDIDPEDENKDNAGASSSSAKSSNSQSSNYLGSMEHEGKTYKTAKIGSQTWFAENINAAPRSGNSWCYGGIEGHCDKRGKLYDWTAANDVCPSGWKLPSKDNYNKLLDYLEEENGNYPAAYLLKSSRDWDSDAGSDRYGFSAIPSGYRSNSSPLWVWLDEEVRWWTSSEADFQSAYYRGIVKNDNNLRSSYDKKAMGFSVRCIKE
ncbi:MAG: hypothetical protein LBH25_06415 [Fibromonadaceae bacterium]|jgi:uncharacterized protein (TIGR02145 family)|nr:hypothetical protein [Fibromonadaceae bacterium]